MFALQYKNYFSYERSFFSRYHASIKMILNDSASLYRSEATESFK